jgi:hypothetical protein
MKAGVCRYFNGIHNDICNKGVNYKENDGGQGEGYGARLACFPKDHPRGGERASCNLFDAATAQEEKEFKTKAMERLGAMAAAISEIKEKHGIETEWETPTDKNNDARGTIECPTCEGVLHYTVAGYNGHVWGKCETDGCLEWMQ